MLTNKDYCDYDTCVALRELGYDAPQRLLVDYFGVYDEPQYDERIHLYEAQKWLREVHNIHILIDRYGKDYHWYIKKKDAIIGHDVSDYESYIDYESALLGGIKEAVKLLKEEK